MHFFGRAIEMGGTILCYFSQFKSNDEDSAFNERIVNKVFEVYYCLNNVQNLNDL